MNILALKSDLPNYSVAGECLPGALVIREGPLIANIAPAGLGIKGQKIQA